MRLRPWMVTVAVPMLCYLLLDVVARLALSSDGWFDSWQYSTRADPELGFRLRANLSNDLNGAPTYTNADGFRDQQPGRHFRAKAPRELLIAALGDSNTFGAGVSYESTYPVLLEQKLQTRLDRAVRVLNMGGPGYSLVQSFTLLKRWAHLKPDVLVVAVNSLNDRVFVGRPDSPRAFEHDARSRSYEFGGFISYPMLYWQRRRQLQFVREARAPEFRQRPPVPRVPKALFATVLREIIQFTRTRGIGLVLLTTAVSGDSRWSEVGMKALGEDRLEDALRAFGEAQKTKEPLFLPAYYAYRCALTLKRQTEAQVIRKQYEKRYATVTDPYQLNFSHFSIEYLPIIEPVAARFDVPLVDVRQQFQDKNVRFVKGHYDATGHALVAERLAARMEAMVGLELPKGNP